MVYVLYIMDNCGRACKGVVCYKVIYSIYNHPCLLTVCNKALIFFEIFLNLCKLYIELILIQWYIALLRTPSPV